MKFLKFAALGLLALVAVLLGVALFLPSKWHVEVKVETKASPAAIHPHVENLRAWEQWTTWKKDDPEAAYKYTGSERGAGATMSWVGKKVGTGTLTIAESDPATGIGYTMSMEGGTPATGRISYAVKNAGTKDAVTTITWVDDGDFGTMLPARYFVGVMEKMLTDNFQKNLDQLKALAEKQQVELDKAAAEKAAADANKPAPGTPGDVSSAAGAAPAAAENPPVPVEAK